MRLVNFRRIGVTVVMVLLLPCGVIRADDAKDTKSIVGKWVEPSAMTVIEFKKDGTFIGDDKQVRKWRISKGRLIITFLAVDTEVKYSLKGDTLKYGEFTYSRKK